MKSERELDICRAWRALFLNDDGTFKPDAELVIRDLEGMCDWMSTALPIDKRDAVDPYRAVGSLAKRNVFANVKKRLFQNLEPMKRRIENDG